MWPTAQRLNGKLLGSGDGIKRRTAHHITSADRGTMIQLLAMLMAQQSQSSAPASTAIIDSIGLSQ
jgi:hypothetical protein